MSNWLKITALAISALIFSDSSHAQQTACVPPAHGLPLIPQGSPDSLLNLEMVNDPTRGYSCVHAYLRADTAEIRLPAPRNHSFQYIVAPELANRQRMLFITPGAEAMARSSALSLEVYRQTFEPNPRNANTPSQLRVLLERAGNDGNPQIHLNVIVSQGTVTSTALSVPVSAGTTCTGPNSSFAACVSINSFPDRIELTALSGPASSSTTLAPSAVTEILIGSISTVTGTSRDVFEFAHSVFANH